ncbi:unnamed protein product, partial [Mesorhabditis belari]|uniref:Protein kinase domain-containing protein n=1 Tax=Mesorhabditis belari TaxID=2138241 RepID=A0AAF3F6Y7_9BILA
MVILDRDSEEEALRNLMLMEPMFDTCADKDLKELQDAHDSGEAVSNVTFSQVMFLRGLGYDFNKDDCNLYYTFDEVRNMSIFPRDHHGKPLYSYYDSWNWGLNDIDILSLLNQTEKFENNCTHDDLDKKQVVVFAFISMPMDDAIDRFVDMKTRWNDAMLRSYSINNYIMKIFWTKPNETGNNDVRKYLNEVKKTSKTFISSEENITMLSESDRTKAYGMCANPPATVAPVLDKFPVVAFTVGVGGFLLIVIFIVVVVFVLFTQTSLLNRPAYHFFRFLENRLKLKFAFLVKMHQEITDAGFDRYVAAYRRGEDEWEVDPQNLHISTEKLGSGAAGSVFMGMLSGLPPVSIIYPRAQLVGNYARDENPVAIKKPHDGAGAEERIEFLQEIRFMKTLGFHPHVLTMLGCYIYPLHPLIVTELCEFGDLLSIVRLFGDPKTRSTAPIEVDILPVMAWQICDALSFLASIGIIHRDVAARNVLVTKAKVAKLSDFGLCRKSENLMYIGKKVPARLPLKWMAPEAIEKAEYSHKSDMWSYGVVLYEIFSFGTVPYPTISSEAVLEFVKKGNRLETPQDTPPWLEPLMESCWEEKPADRPMAYDLKAALYSHIETAANSYGYLQMNLDDYPGEENDDEEIEMHANESFKILDTKF